MLIKQFCEGFPLIWVIKRFTLEILSEKFVDGFMEQDNYLYRYQLIVDKYDFNEFINPTTHAT